MAAYFTMTADLTTVANAIAGEDPDDIMQFLADLAQAMDRKKLLALYQSVVDFSEEEQSKALCQLSRAINERDAIPDVE